MKDYTRSKSIFDSLYSHHPDVFTSFNRHIYAQLCLYDKDFETAKQVIDSARPETFDDKVFIYEIKSRYYRALGDYDRALQFSDSSKFYNDKDMVRLLGNNVVKYQRDQNHLQLEEVSEESSTRLRTIIFLIIVILILVYIGYSLVKMHIQKQKNLELKAMEQALLLTRENSILRENSKRLEDRLADQSSKSDLEALWSVYRQLDKICNSYFNKPDSKKQKGLVADVENLINELSTEEMVSTLQGLLDFTHPGLFKALRSDFEFKERDLNILTYTFAGFSYSTTAYIMKETPGAIATQRSRLKKRILHSDSPNIELYRYAFIQ